MSKEESVVQNYKWALRYAFVDGELLHDQDLKMYALCKKVSTN